jgi:hypothetical protein
LSIAFDRQNSRGITSVLDGERWVSKNKPVGAKLEFSGSKISDDYFRHKPGFSWVYFPDEKR